MTVKAARAAGAEHELQWGHGAWPWMTRAAPEQYRGIVIASMGPRRMAVDDRRQAADDPPDRFGFNGATAHGRG